MLKVKNSRKIQDNLIPKLNGLKDRSSDPEKYISECKQMNDIIDDSHNQRMHVIEKCVNQAEESMKALERDLEHCIDPIGARDMQAHLTTIKIQKELMQRELSVETILQKQTKEILSRKCHSILF